MEGEGDYRERLRGCALHLLYAIADKQKEAMAVAERKRELMQQVINEKEAR